MSTNRRGSMSRDEYIKWLKEDIEKSFGGHSIAVSDKGHIQRIMEICQERANRTPDSSSDSSDDESKKRDKPGGFGNGDTEGKPNFAKTNKIRNYKEDKPWFDSYNVFNRVMPPTNKFSNNDDPNKKRREEENLRPNKKNDSAQSSLAQKLKREPEPADGKSNNSKPLHVKIKRLGGKKEAKATVKKISLSRKTLCLISNKSVEYWKAFEGKKEMESDGLLRGEKRQEDRRSKQNVEAKEEEREPEEITPEQQLVLLKTIAETRGRQVDSGYLWDYTVTFLDQGLVYGLAAKERRTWENNFGTVFSDLADPPLDALRLIGLATGGLIIPKDRRNPFDFSDSFLYAMIEKYPILRQGTQGGKEGEHDYMIAIFKRVAEMFPAIIATFHSLAGESKAPDMEKYDFGLPLVVYSEGFPPLICQHLLEKRYNILPFLLVNMLLRLGQDFEIRKPKHKLKMAWIAWKHLKKALDSTSLPWIFREAFCQKHGVCKDADYYPQYTRKREQAIYLVADLVNRADGVSKLMAELDEYDFRQYCPSVTNLQKAVSSKDLKYIDVFYSRAVGILEHIYTPQPGKEPITWVDPFSDDDDDYMDDMEPLEQPKQRENEMFDVLPPEERKAANKIIARDRQRRAKQLLNLKDEID